MKPLSPTKEKTIERLIPVNRSFLWEWESYTPGKYFTARCRELRMHTTYQSWNQLLQAIARLQHEKFFWEWEAGRLPSFLEKHNCKLLESLPPVNSEIQVWFDVPYKLQPASPFKTNFDAGFPLET